MEPRERIEKAMLKVRIPDRQTERFSGFGVMGLPFASGHILALRNFPVSSVGPGYIAVWHRSPEDQWTFYTTVPAEFSCPRYFGEEASATVETPITLAWVGPGTLRITAPEAGLDWTVTGHPTGVTRMLNAVSGAMPEAAWASPAVLKAMGPMAGSMLGVGMVKLLGKTPNRQQFITSPRVMWKIRQSKAVLNGEDFGAVGPVFPQARLGDFWIPNQGILAIGQVEFENFNPALHSGRLQK